MPAVNPEEERDMATITPQAPAATRAGMDWLRKTSLAAGVLYLLTFVSIPTLFLYVPVHDPKYILGPGPDTAVRFGGLLEVIVALAGVGTAVVLYPVLKRQNQAMALGLVGSRVLEGAGILAGVACLLSIVGLRQAGVGAAGLVIAQTLAILYDRIFLLSGSLMPAVDDLLLGLLLYWSRLVPRVLPLIAFIGVPLLLASDAAKLFGLLAPTASAAALAALPVAIFEFSVGVYLVVKGFKPSPITADYNRSVGVDKVP
jgi:Domain of unknown function (DUF4386)